MSAPKDNLIRVGQKPLMNYVVACVTLFNSGINQIIVRARGKAIAKAVDVVEMLRRSFIKDLVIKSVNVGSDNFKSENKDISISTIEIVLIK